MLELNRQLLDEIGQQGITVYPYEGCGLLLGRAGDGRRQVAAHFPVANTWPVEAEKRERFRIDERDWLRAEVTAAEASLDIIGIYHSHPDHPAVASPRDLAWASWPGYSYLIAEIRHGQFAACRSWQLLPDRSGFVEEEVLVPKT